MCGCHCLTQRYNKAAPTCVRAGSDEKKRSSLLQAVSLPNDYTTTYHKSRGLKVVCFVLCPFSDKKNWRSPADVQPRFVFS